MSSFCGQTHRNITMCWEMEVRKRLGPFYQKISEMYESENVIHFHYNLFSSSNMRQTDSCSMRDLLQVLIKTKKQKCIVFFINLFTSLASSLNFSNFKMKPAKENSKISAFTLIPSQKFQRPRSTTEL